MSKYDAEVDLTNPNTSHSLMVELVGHNKEVLDVGCSSGFLAEVLVAHGCVVSGVEYDEGAADAARPVLSKLVVGDLEQLDLVAEFGEASFDVLVFGDVLEHLRTPLSVLRQARRLLRPSGYVVISLPNVAHASVRLGLLSGRFDYSPTGLLDDTHLRFFTRRSIDKLLDRAGLIGIDLRRTIASPFETEITVRAEDYPPALLEQILEDPDASTYQFVVKAIVDNADDAVRQVAELADALRIRVRELERERDDLGAIAHDERAQHLAAEQALLAVGRERDELGAIAHDERAKHLAAEERWERRWTSRVARRFRPR